MCNFRPRATGVCLCICVYFQTTCCRGVCVCVYVCTFRQRATSVCLCAEERVMRGSVLGNGHGHGHGHGHVLLRVGQANGQTCDF